MSICIMNIVHSMCIQLLVNSILFYESNKLTVQPVHSPFHLWTVWIEDTHEYVYHKYIYHEYSTWVCSVFQKQYGLRHVLRKRYGFRHGLCFYNSSKLFDSIE